MIAYQFPGKWIIFGGYGIGQDDHIDWTLDINAHTLPYDDYKTFKNGEYIT